MARLDSGFKFLPRSFDSISGSAGRRGADLSEKIASVSAKIEESKKLFGKPLNDTSQNQYCKGPDGVSYHIERKPSAHEFYKYPIVSKRSPNGDVSCLVITPEGKVIEIRTFKNTGMIADADAGRKAMKLALGESE